MKDIGSEFFMLIFFELNWILLLLTVQTSLAKYPCTIAKHVNFMYYLKVEMSYSIYKQNFVKKEKVV